MGEIRRRAVGRDGSFRLLGIADLKGRPADVPEAVAWTDGYDALIRQDDVEAVFVCVPNALGPEVACRSLAAGKHVFCEKPPGRTVSDVVRMREAEAGSPGRKLMFGFNHRFHPAMLEAKRLVDGGELGRVLFVRGVYGKPGGKDFERSWRNDPAQSGGGVLLDQGIHMVDLFRYYCGDFERAKAFCAASYYPLAVEDNAFVVFENDRGQHAVLHSSTTLWRPCFRLEIGLAGGYLVAEGLLTKTGRYGPETLTVGRRPADEAPRPVGTHDETRHVYTDDGSWATEVSNFARAIIEDRPVEQCSSYDALRAMELVHAAYADSRRPGGT
jgi:predicted dehydrogenase